MKETGQLVGLVNVANNGTQDEKQQVTEDEDDHAKRTSWSHESEYLLSLLGYSVGIGNIWRFPYICNRNGGGAFLLPFMLFVAFCGIPLFFLETALGQFTGKSPVQAWSVCPLFKGIGIAIFILHAILNWYYTTIMSWSLYYLACSFKSTLPWTRCDQWWNTPRCIVTSHYQANMTSQMTTVLSNSTQDGENQTIPLETWKPVSAAEEFWQHNALQVSRGPDEIGQVVWYLAVCQCAMILVLFLALVKGIKSSGKVVYVTALAPYVLLSVLLIRGATLPGAREGILFYITPDFRPLKDPKVWIEAALQVFYSLGPGWGVIITLSSYNKFNNNCLRDSILLSVVGEGTSIFGGFVIFSILGYMAHSISVPINEVVSSGPGLVFIAYPEAISLMPLPQLWAVLFFFMIITAVFDSMLGSGETVLSIVSDQFPGTMARHRLLLTASFYVLVAMTSLIFVTQGGVYIFQLVDWFIGTCTISVIAFLECAIVGWIYGADRFAEDIEMMIGRKPPMIMRFLWCFFTPVMMVVLLVSTLWTYESPTYGDYHYDTLATVIGWMVAMVSFLPIPGYAVYLLFTARGTLIQRLKQTTSPDDRWGPPNPKRRRQYCQHVLQRKRHRGCLDIILN